MFLFGVSVWKSDLDRVNPGWVVRNSEKGLGITLVWQVPNSAGSPNSKPGFGPVPSPSSESKHQTRVRPCSFSELRTCRARVRSSRSFLRTPNQNSELRVKHSPGPNRYLLHGPVGHAQQLRILKHEHTVSHFSYAPLLMKRNTLFLFWDYQRKAHLYWNFIVIRWETSEKMDL